jgi:hypothetical protein
MIPVKPTLHETLRFRCAALATALPRYNPQHQFAVHFDSRPIPPEPGDCRPWSKVTRIRNKMLETSRWEEFDYVLWIDADVVGYPVEMPTTLVESAGEGISSPLPLIEGSMRLYDWAGCVVKGGDIIQPTNRNRLVGRNLQHEPPYWPTDPKQDVVEVDCSGTCMMIHTSVYHSGVRHEDHPAFTDWYPICKRARDMGKKVVIDRRIHLFHAELPRYGERWH